MTPGTAFRLRACVENTGAASETITQPDTTRGISRCGSAQLAYSSLTNIINGADAGSSADAANVTVQRLTSATGSFATGTAGYDENETLSCALLNGNFTEVEFGMVLTGGPSTIGAGGGETWTFQAGGLTNASAQVPTFTTPNTDGSDFQHGNQLGGAGQATANSTSISMTTAADIRAGNLAVIVVSCDNNGTTDSDFSEITSVYCGSVRCFKAKEFTNGQGTAQTGVTTSVWYCQPKSQINSGAAIVATFANPTTNGDACAIQAREYIVAAGKEVTVEATNAAATDAGTQPASINCTTSNIECLRIAAHGFEWGITAANQADTVRASNSGWSLWWTSAALARCSALSAAATAISNIVESTISTGTGAASQIGTLPAAATADWASVYVAFRADTVTYSSGGFFHTVGSPIGGVINYVAAVPPSDLGWQGTTWRKPAPARPAFNALVASGPIQAPQPISANNTTNTVWPLTQGMKAAPVPRPAPQGGATYVTIEVPYLNTTNLVWPLTFGEKARPIPAVAPQGMWAFGYPYASEENTQTIDKWQQPLSRSVPIPRAAPPGGQPFVPKEVVLDVITPDKWLLRWAGPPRLLLPLAAGSVYVEIQFVDNTVTPDKWLRGLSGAAIRPRARHVHQQFIGVPTTVPPNTVTPDKWLRPLAQLPRRLPPVHSRPFFGRAIPFVDNTATVEKWLLRWRFPPRILPRLGRATFLRGELGAVYMREITAEIKLSVDVHVCGWGTEDEAAEGFAEQTEQTDPWSEQSERSDDYDEQEECGR